MSKRRLGVSGPPVVRMRVIYGGRRGHGRKVWGYSYDEIAAAAGTSVGSVRVAVSQGYLDPSDLVSVSKFILKRRKG